MIHCQHREVSRLKKEPLSLFSSVETTVEDEMAVVSAWSLLELSTVRDSDLLGGSPGPWTKRLHFLDHFHSLLHYAKDNMPAIQPE